MRSTRRHRLHYTLEALIGKEQPARCFGHSTTTSNARWRLADSRQRIWTRNLPTQRSAEAEFSASLEHPNIASIYGVEHSDRDRAIVMEYIDGHTLAERLQQGPLLDEAIKMAISISHAMEAAHAKGIVHRDLKPGNIKINSRNEIKVLDLGSRLSSPTSTGFLWRQLRVTLQCSKTKPPPCLPKLPSSWAPCPTSAQSKHEAPSGSTERHLELWMCPF